MTTPELPEWIDKIREHLAEDAEINILRASETDSIPEAFQSRAESDCIALLEHCMKLREALDAIEEMDVAWDKGPFRKIERECVNCPRPLPPDYRRDICDKCLIQKAKNHKPEGV